MTATAFLDTNVFLYAAMRALPEADEFKKPIALELIAQCNFGVSAQVLGEFYYNARKKGSAPLSHGEALEWLDLMARQPLAQLDGALVQAGAALAERYDVSYWDGAMLAAANLLGVETFYSEDLNDGQTYGDVRVINPFKPQTH
ncbi:MAG: VapC toxin family PIN domain ribonuclease [Novosphingobium sp.]|nr:VapC toxin family PIN domain ribonuclease [Novosphingobium sp.]